MWCSCEDYRAFVDFISDFPRFQFASFKWTEWRNVKVKLRIWFEDPDCSRLLATDHFSRNFWTRIAISGPEVITISDSVLSGEIITISDDDEPHESQSNPVPARLPHNRQYDGIPEVIYDLPEDWISSDMMDLDPSSADEIGSEALSTTTFADNSIINSYLPPENNSLEFYNRVNRAELGYQLTRSANYSQPLEQQVSNLDIVDYSRRDSGVDIVSNDC